MNTQDTDLERRLSSIGHAAPEAPAALDDFARQVALEGRTRLAAGSRRLRPGALRWLGAVAATLAVVVLTASVLRIAATNPSSADWTPRVDAGAGQWTAIEWHDVSARFDHQLSTGPSWLRAPGSMVRWADGFASSDEQARWWLSDDGLSWRLAPAIPDESLVGVVNNQLLVFDRALARAWTTVDGEHLQPIAAPDNLGQLSQVVSGKPGALAVAFAPGDAASGGVKPSGLATFRFTADGASWSVSDVPSDLAGSRLASVRAFLGGFLAVGDVDDPNGSGVETYSMNGGPEQTWRFTETAWYSRDGIHWAKYSPSLPATETPLFQTSWFEGAYEGRLGATVYDLHSTDGGRTWSQGEIPEGSFNSDQVDFDGTRIVMATDGGARFYLSEGDGNWILLKQGGNVPPLAADGVMLLEPKGILWIMGSTVYFGEGLAGIEPVGSIAPPISPLPPTPAPSRSGPWVVPAQPIQASSPTPPPSARP